MPLSLTLSTTPKCYYSKKRIMKWQFRKYIRNIKQWRIKGSFRSVLVIWNFSQFFPFFIFNKTSFLKYSYKYRQLFLDNIQSLLSIILLFFFLHQMCFITDNTIVIIEMSYHVTRFIRVDAGGHKSSWERHTISW